MASLDRLQQWLISKENEHLEFKEAKSSFHFEELVKYCVALANEGGGRMVLGHRRLELWEIGHRSSDLDEVLEALRDVVVDEQRRFVQAALQLGVRLVGHRDGDEIHRRGNRSEHEDGAGNENSVCEGGKDAHCTRPT